MNRATMLAWMYIQRAVTMLWVGVTTYGLTVFGPASLPFLAGVVMSAAGAEFWRRQLERP